MKIVWVLFGVIMVGLIGISIWKKANIHDENKVFRPNANTDMNSSQILKNITQANQEEAKVNNHLPVNLLQDSLVLFALKQKGILYEPSGLIQAGFDCSGFVQFVFARFGIPLPHSSELLAQEGLQVSAAEAQKADIIIFTGTQPTDRSPGHVGIVISNSKEPVTFIHASSNGGVKVSTVDSTGYKPRFLQVRRVL